MSERMKYLNDDNFDSVVNSGVTLVDFYADWCGPCRMIAPIMEELADEMTNATIAKVDIEKSQQVTSRFGVTSIPTIIIFNKGTEVRRFVGVKDKETLAEALNLALAS